MRLELNARAGCYNLYCDTREEHEKLKLMMQQPITSIDSVLYADTDSVKIMKTKLNSVYGKVVTDMIKDYIVVHQSNRAGVIFKDRIDGVLQREDGTLVLVDGYSLCIDDKYTDIVAKLI